MQLKPDSKVLVVDDEPNVILQNQLILCRVYSLHIDDILTANDGEEALEILHDNPDVDLIISDMDMPAMDGLTFFQEMRQLSDDNIPFIMSTGGNAELRGEIEHIFSLLGGNAAFTEKPFSISKLTETLETLLPRRDGMGMPDSTP